MVSFRDSETAAAWRREVVGFIDDNLPNGRKGMDTEAWFEKLRERGWHAPAWPTEYGGAGLSVVEQFVLNEEFAARQLPRPSAGVGMALAGPTLITWGTEEQKARFIPEILKPGAFWCQLYSEPGAGSDLASLTTRAVRDGDNWVLNGQKIWTTYGHRAQYAICLARTDPDAPKHKGISYFIVDMKSPGITIRPLVNMGFQHEFNETFLEDVVVPNENIVGGVNRGWNVGTSTLNFERSNIGSATQVKRQVAEIAQWVATQPDLARRQEIRNTVADLSISAEISRLLGYRVVSLQLRGTPPSYESSVAKLYTTELLQRIGVQGMRIVGMKGLVLEGPLRLGSHALRYLLTVQTTIAGGTSEIQRSLIAGKGLGMPRE